MRTGLDPVAITIQDQDRELPIQGVSGDIASTVGLPVEDTENAIVAVSGNNTLECSTETVGDTFVGTATFDINRQGDP